jgi:hypothetical protein
LDAVDRYLAPAFVNHDPFPGFAPHREGMRQTAVVFRQAFPDWHAGQQASPVHRHSREAEYSFISPAGFEHLFDDSAERDRARKTAPATGWKSTWPARSA